MKSTLTFALLILCTVYCFALGVLSAYVSWKPNTAGEVADFLQIVAASAFFCFVVLSGLSVDCYRRRKKDKLQKMQTCPIS